MLIKKMIYPEKVSDKNINYCEDHVYQFHPNNLICLSRQFSKIVFLGGSQYVNWNDA